MKNRGCLLSFFALLLALSVAFAETPTAKLSSPWKSVEPDAKQAKDFSEIYEMDGCKVFVRHGGTGVKIISEEQYQPGNILRQVVEIKKPVRPWPAHFSIRSIRTVNGETQKIKGNNGWDVFYHTYLVYASNLPSHVKKAFHGQYEFNH